MIITLEILTDVYSTPDKNNKQKIIKKGVKYLKQFNTDNILIEQFINKNGTINSKVCTVKDGDNYYKVNYRFNKLSELTENKRVEIKGFYDKRKYNR